MQSIANKTVYIFDVDVSFTNEVLLGQSTNKKIYITHMYTHSLKSMRNLSSTSKMRQNEEKINITSNDRISYEMYPIEILKCHKRTHVIQIGECVPCRYS